MSSYRIPSDVAEALKMAKQVLFYPVDEQNRSPRILVVFDGDRLPRDPEERQQKTKALYQTLFWHIQNDAQMGSMFRCNATSDNTTRSLRTLQSAQAVEKNMPLPHQQSDNIPDNYYLRPNYVMRIENNCDDPKEHENFRLLAQAWKQRLRQLQRR